MSRVLVDVPVWLLDLMVRAAKLAREHGSFTAGEKMGLQSAVVLFRGTIAGAEPSAGPPTEPGTLEHYLNTVIKAGFLELAAAMAGPRLQVRRCPHHHRRNGRPRHRGCRRFYHHVAERRGLVRA